MQTIFYPKYCIGLINFNKCVEDALVIFYDSIYSLNLYNIEDNNIKIKFNNDIKCLLEASIINIYHKTFSIINNSSYNNSYCNLYFVLNKKNLLNISLKEYFDQQSLYKLICKYTKKLKIIDFNRDIFIFKQTFIIENEPDGNVIELIHKINNKYK
jgi:hypothetical protein